MINFGSNSCTIMVHELEPKLIITKMHGQQHIKTHQTFLV